MMHSTINKTVTNPHVSSKRDANRVSCQDSHSIVAGKEVRTAVNKTSDSQNVQSDRVPPATSFYPYYEGAESERSRAAAHDDQKNSNGIPSALKSFALYLEPC